MNILIIDDHFLIIEGYKSILANNNLGLQINISVALNCELGYKLITQNKDLNAYDVVYLDLNLPEYLKENIFSGEKLAYLTKKYLPKCKLIISTSYSEVFRLYDIIKGVRPNGILIKSDLTKEIVLFSLKKILLGEVYYSDAVKTALSNITLNISYLDKYNRKIISLLSQGVQTKSLPKYIPLSISSIDKRKVLIKEYLCINKGTDEDIIREAKKRGFI